MPSYLRHCLRHLSLIPLPLTRQAPLCHRTQLCHSTEHAVQNAIEHFFDRLSFPVSIASNRCHVSAGDQPLRDISCSPASLSALLVVSCSSERFQIPTMTISHKLGKALLSTAQQVPTKGLLLDHFKNDLFLMTLSRWLILDDLFLMILRRSHHRFFIV